MSFKRWDLFIDLSLAFHANAVNIVFGFKKVILVSLVETICSLLITNHYLPITVLFILHCNSKCFNC